MQLAAVPGEAPVPTVIPQQQRERELGIAMLDGHQPGLVIAQRPVLDQLTKAQRSKATHKRSASRTSSPTRHMITNLALGRTVLTNTQVTSHTSPVIPFLWNF